MEGDILTSYNKFDRGQKGYLTKFEYKLAFSALLGYEPCEADIAQLNHTGPKPTIKKFDFLSTMLPKLNSVGKDEKYKQMFMAFDVKSRGYLTIEDVQMAFQHFCKAIPDHVIEQAFSEFVQEGSSHISYGSFCNMLEYTRDKGLLS
ncbi:hypothetical protein AKO1_009905 [Acrasis kona]|uniref:EF-hand domain-containing protein n=1 Tax=Acrasis kona TaxID=1008807 RepID=A0AAW2ZQ79_9EUKA